VPLRVGTRSQNEDLAMIKRASLAFVLCVLIVAASSAQAEKYPTLSDDDVPYNTIGGSYRVVERTPVYRSRSPGERAFFYLPRNSQVEILGKYQGWGVFSTYIAERFPSHLTDAAPDEKTQYAWVRLEGLHPIDASKSSCPDIPAASSEDAYFNCGGEYESVSSTDVVVFRPGHQHAGHTYRRLEDSRLNQCIKTCRDEQKCVGFSIPQARAAAS
jgi:hypothetical protein